MKQLMGDSSSKRASKQGNRYSHFFVRVGFILLMLGLIAFSIYQLISHMTVGLDTLRTQEITEESYVTLELFMFRDEELVTAPANLYRYHVNDGERVGVSDRLATLYEADAETEDVEALQELLNLYAQRLALAEDRDGAATLDEVVALKESLDKAYLTLLAAADEGRTHHGTESVRRLKEGLRQYAVLVGTAEDDREHPAELSAAMDLLLEGCAVKGELTTPHSGYFYYDTDGYELLFDVDQVMTMTTEDFRELTQTPAQSYLGNVAGKMVYSSTWYAAAYISLSDASRTAFEVGETYTMLCSDSMDTEINMTVVRMEAAADGALVVFETDRMPQGFAFNRCFTARAVTGRTGGYRIPAEALVTLTSSEGVATKGVYILSGNVVEFRKVHIVVSREGYSIVATYDEVMSMLDALPENEREQITADGWSYLKLNDKIITRGTGLYEGKMIS